MGKLVALTLAILATAALIFPSAAAARGVEVQSGKYDQESFNTPGKDHFSSVDVTSGGKYKLGYGPERSVLKPSYIAGQKLVCLTFDDGWKNQYDNALPVLQQYGFKATFAVVTTWIGDGQGTDQCMSYTELHALANQGMDIASHTRTHPHLPNLGASDLQNEVANSKTALEQSDFTVRTLVYPYYEYNSTVVTAVKNAGYICARSGALNNPYNPGNRTDPNAQYYMDAIEINTQDINAFKSIVNQATDQSVICLCYHSVSNNTSSPTPITPVANFAQQMQYLKDNDFAVVLLPDLVQDPWIACSPVSLTFGSMQGESNPATQTLNISNSGGGTLTWTASSSAAWLTLAPTSGTAPGTVTVTAAISGLSAGTYNGTITITATGATNTPQTVPVTLTVQTPSSNWLAGWSYRKQITIAGSSAGAQTNYPMKLTINRSAGTDSGATGYLGTKCDSDYKDIRFTKYDGITLLDYWIESSTSSTATVWVELDSIPTSPGTANFNLYYGNSGVTSASNIKNTFTFADDFDDGSLDTARWTTGGGAGGTVTEANGVLTVTAGSSNQKYAASINTYNNAYALHTRAKVDSIAGCSSFRMIGFVTTLGSYADKLFTTTHRWYYSGANFLAISGDGSSATQADMNVAADTNYHVSECRRYAVSGTNYDRFIIDGGAAVNGSKPTATARYIYINSDESGKAIIVDWIFLRKYVSVEPTWSVWGSEETSGSPPPSPTISFSPTILIFSGIQGGNNPATQVLNISNSGGGTLTWTASSSASWLTLAPTTGTAPSTVTVTAISSGLSAGTYNGTITITATSATNTPQSVPVTLSVQAQPPIPIKLLGVSSDLAPDGFGGNSYLHLNRFTAEATGNLSTIKVRSDSSGAAKVAIYADSSGTPGTLLNANNTGSPISSGWNDISLPSTQVIQGTPYWLAIALSGTVGYKYGGTRQYKAINYSNFSFPSQTDSSFTSDSFNMLDAGWGSSAPPTPTTPAVTNLTGASSITATSARLNGELTSNGNENPTVHVYWGDNDGSTTPVNWDHDVNLGQKPAGSFYSDITGLTTGTTYYYRCYAQNSAGSSWASASSSFVAQTQSVPIKLLGVSSDLAPDGFGGNSYLHLNRFTAESTGNVITIKVRSDSSGAAKVAIYADSSGTPGTLLNANNTGSPISSGWNDISLPSTQVIQGTPYWLAIALSGKAGYKSGGTRQYKSISYSSFTFPSQTDSSFTSDSFTMLDAGWGLSVPLTPTTPAVTNSAGASAVTATAARLNGELTSNGNEDPTVHIYWGATDGGTTPSSWTNDINLGQKPAGTFYSDITGLTTGTTYYYRCYAQNSAGSSWASASSSFVAQTQSVPIKLLGVSSDLAPDGYGGNSYLHLNRFTAEATGNIGTIKVRSNSSGSAKVAIYADSSGTPGTLLNANNTGSPISSGWNDISLPSTQVIQGTPYWLAIALSGKAGYKSGGTRQYKSISYSSFTFPSQTDSSFTSDSFNMLDAGWGVSAPLSPPSPPVLISPGASITFQWGTSTGATKYWLQVNTSSGFTGTDVINADIGNLTLREVTGFSLGTTYYWRVRAGNDSGWSPWSSTRSLTTN